MTDPAEGAIAPKPKSSSWRRRRSSMPPEHMNRQGRIAHLAYSLLGSRDAAILFLNTHHAELGATPLEHAGKSIAGYSAVQSEVQRLSLVAREEPS